MGRPQTHEVMTAATWSTVRHALALALHRPDGISQGEYDRAMTEVMGTSDRVTVRNWYLSSPAQLQAIQSGDGRTLDSQLQTLVSAMAAYTTAHPGFDPTNPANGQAPTDPTLQAAIAAAWHP